MANRIEAILEGKDVQPQNSYEAALKQHVAQSGEGGGGSGGGVLIATPAMDGTFVVDLPIAEVATAMEKGAKIALYVESGGEPVACTLLEFSSWSKSGGTMRIMAYNVNVDLTTEIYSCVGTADGNTTKFAMIQHS